MFEINYSKNKELGLWEATGTLTLPTITLTRYKNDKSDFRYDMARAFSEIVEQIVEKAVEQE